MPKFVKKPVEIEAEHLPRPEVSVEAGAEFNRVARWCSGSVVNDAVDGISVLIDTPEGQMKAVPPCYIIKGVIGEFYPCKVDVFVETYDKVDD